MCVFVKIKFASGQTLEYIYICTPVCICVRMRHLLTPSKICTPEYNYTCVFLAHANWTKVSLYKLLMVYSLGFSDSNHLSALKKKKKKKKKKKSL